MSLEWDTHFRFEVKNVIIGIKKFLKHYRLFSHFRIFFSFYSTAVYIKNFEDWWFQLPWGSGISITVKLSWGRLYTQATTRVETKAPYDVARGQRNVMFRVPPLDLSTWIIQNIDFSPLAHLSNGMKWYLSSGISVAFLLETLACTYRNMFVKCVFVETRVEIAGNSFMRRHARRDHFW